MVRRVERHSKLSPIQVSGPRNENIFKESFKMTLKEYLQGSTIAGLKYLVDPRQTCIEKVMWFVVVLSAMVASICTSLHVWFEFVDVPTVVSVESPQYPIWKVPFPAIGICSANKLSKKRVMKYAKELEVMTDFPYDLMMEFLRYFGRNVDQEYEGFELYSIFMEEIVAVDDDNGTTLVYDMAAKMKMLSPTCEEILVQCKWAGRIEPCENLFTLRKTMDGYCCVFNYFDSIDHDDENDKVIKNVILETPGIGKGLSVVGRTDLEDYFYPISSEGFKVLIFEPNTYPDSFSGSLIEKMASVNRELFVDIKATTMFSVPDVKRFTIQQRKCLFGDENISKFKGAYSLSNCLVMCRIRSVIALCKCVPFFMPNQDKNVPYCNLIHIRCLNKYKVKFRTVLSNDFLESREEGLEEEREDGLLCQECYPDCSWVAYKSTASSYSIKNKKINSHVTDGIDLVNHTIMHFYYLTADTLLYKQDVLYYWFEIVSILGGTVGLYLGFSIISVIEFVYYFTLRFYSLLRENGYKFFGRY